MIIKKWGVVTISDSGVSTNGFVIDVGEGRCEDVRAEILAEAIERLRVALRESIRGESE